MRNRFVSIFAIIVMLSGAYICARTDKYAPFKKPESAEGTDNIPAEEDMQYRYITHYLKTEDDPDFGGPYILKYNPREKQVYHFASADAAKWELLSSGKPYYDSSTDEQTGYGYREINALGEVVRELHFELTQNFVKAQGDAPPYVTYEELFADLSVLPPELKEVSDYTQANTDKFFKIAEEYYGFFHEHAQIWFDIVTEDAIFDGGVRELSDLLFDDIDGNGAVDLIIMLRQPETEYKPDMGVLYFYMNGKEPYCFTDEDFSVPLPVNICYTDLNRNGNVEIVFALRGAGNGRVEDWYKAILSYSEGNNVPF